MAPHLADPLFLTCVPNFAVGRDQGLTAALVAAICSVTRARADVAMLDVSSDADHNRAVVTLAGAGPGLLAVLWAAASSLADHVDLQVHKGEHPVVGAVDVVPFVALDEAATPLAVAMAREAAKLLWTDFRIPSFFYGLAATCRARESLPEIRSQLRRSPGRGALPVPDVGDRGLHPRLGASVVGVRRPLVALNVRLATHDVATARAIARAVRERDGGLAGVRALGLSLPSRGEVQVSMNLTDLDKTGVSAALLAVERHATRYNVQVAGRELIGLAPEAALRGVHQGDLECPGTSGQASLEVALQAAHKLSTDCGKRWG